MSGGRSEHAIVGGMTDGTNDTMSVRFPASEQFARIGRVATAGLALRLDLDVGRVEQLRLAVDEAVSCLIDEAGEIELMASWNPSELRIELSNESATLSKEAQNTLAGRLNGLVDRASIGARNVALHVNG